jgi:hypothetical protein
LKKNGEALVEGVELRCCLLLFPSFGFGFWLCVVDDEWIGEGWK